jgi:hypothetical protein
VTSHDHLHVQSGPGWIRRIGHAHASFCLGVLHGVAGTSHFVGVLPALALPTRAAAMTYIAAFGIGTVAAMTAFAAAAGSLGSSRHSAFYRTAMASAAVVAMAVGGWWLVGGQ